MDLSPSPPLPPLPLPFSHMLEVFVSQDTFSFRLKGIFFYPNRFDLKFINLFILLFNLWKVVRQCAWKIQVYDVSRKIRTTKGEELEVSKQEFFETFKILEGELGDKPYFGGEAFGFVDLSLITFYSWFHVFEVFGNINIDAECPKIIAWAKRCLQKETVANSLPDQKKVYEAVVQLRKICALEQRNGLAQILKYQHIRMV